MKYFLILMFIFFLTDARADKLRLDSIHGAAPELVLSNGKTQDRLSQHRGHPLILHFWADWCSSCLKELPQLKSLVDQAKEKDIYFLPVSAGEPEKEAEARKFITAIPGNFEFWKPVEKKALTPYLTWGLPVTYFISKDGELLSRALGARDWSTADDLGAVMNKIFKK